MKEITINSFEELQDLVFATCWDEKTMRYRNNFVYRGVPDKNYDLSSKLSRICRHDLSLEASIIRSFKKYGYTDVKECSSFWQILAMGQHYGLPTRLLDWTYSPLVAAHFATENIYMYDHDGAIYCMDLKEGERHLPLCLKKELAASCAQSFTMAMLQRHAENLEELFHKPCLLGCFPQVAWMGRAGLIETRPALSPRSECFDGSQAGLLWRQGMPCLYKTVCSFYAGRCPALSAARPLALEGVCLIYLVEGKLLAEVILIHQFAGGELRHRVGFGHVSTHCHDVNLREGGLDE